MGACSTSDCCGTDGNNIDTNQQMSDRSSMVSQITFISFKVLTLVFQI